MAELFENFEVNRKPRAPRLLRTLGGSILLHALLLAAIIYVPTVRSMFHLMGMFSNAQYVDEAYTKGKITERVTIINLTDPNGKFQYPAGYFSKSQPTVNTDAQVIAEVKPQAQPKLPKVRPTPKPAPSVQPTPAATPEVSASPSIAETNAETKLTDEQKKAKQEALDKLAAQNNVKLPPRINTKPLKDLLKKGNEMYVSGDLNLKGTIHLTLEADREDDGTLTHMVMTGGSASDPALKELAGDVVNALSSSHALQFLEGTKHLTLTLTLDERKIAVSAQTTLDSQERASQLANVYSIGIVGQRINTAGKDEGELWKRTAISSDGNQITIKFEMPRDTAKQMITKQLASSGT